MSLCLFVCLSVCLSVTNRCSIKTVECIINAAVPETPVSGAEDLGEV